jgi:3-hydroxyisobutyrate dehydrogenase-like beta-hydroxyacid dehydrogenase
MTDIEKVGFVGLGDIGEPMARNLCGHDWEVVVYDVRDEAIQLLVDCGAAAAKSNREVGERCDVICVCVLDDAITERVVAGEGGILEGARPGSIIAIHSTVKPETVHRLAARAAQTGVAVIDAQMTGGRAKTEQKQLRYMVGGDPEAVERCLPIFETSAEEITNCGALGNGAVAKLCNNLVQYQAWQAYVEAHLLATTAGLAEDKLLEVLSWIMNDNARLFLAARNALEANPDNEFLHDRYTALQKLAEKDIGNALAAAQEVGVSMPATALCQQQLGRICGLPDKKRR